MTIEYKDSKRIIALSSDVANTPTVNDDLITDKGWDTQGITDKGWDTQGHIGMTYDATNDEVDFNCVADTTHDYALIDLQDADYINGSNISDTAFELRCGWRVDTISNASANENRATIGLYANNTSNNTAQDIFTLRFSATTGGGQALEMFAKDNAIAVGGSAEYTFTETLSAQTLYLRFNRDGNNFRIRLYSDSNYTTLVEDSGNQSVSGITGLRYFGIKNRGDTQNNGGSTTGAILPNIEIYDGISSTTNKPTNVQDNSLLVEKDTASRYWFNARGADTTSSQSSFDNDSKIENGASQYDFVGQQFLSGHSLIGQSISSISFWLWNIGSGSTTGATYSYGVFDSNGNLKGDVFGTLNVSDITQASSYTGATKRTMTTSSPVTIAENDFIGIRTNQALTSTAYDIEIGTGGNGSIEDNAQRVRGSAGSVTQDSHRDVAYEVIHATPATWTNEDIFTDDYSSDSGWTSVGSSTTVNSAVAGKVNMTGDIDNWVYKDLGFNLKSKWIARGNIKATVYGTTGRSLVPVTFIDDPTIHVKNGTGNNGIGVFMDTTGGTRYFWLSIITNGAYDRGTNDSNHRISFTTGTTYYYELIRDGSTLTLRITTNSDFSGGSVITRTTTLPSNTFRYLVHGTDVATSGSNTVEADDTVVHNGVTLIN
jgi:hypothetical protein